ncbi:MAG: hypothetical protein AB1714_30020 [Acidobacteriota bacterium]
MSDNVVVLGGGPYQRHLVRFLQAKKHTVYVVNPRPTETTSLARHVEADILDIETVYRAVRELDPLFIVSDQSDVASMPVAILSERLGLPGNRPDVVELFTNKAAMYAYAQSLGIPVLPFREVVTPNEAAEFARQTGYPVVIKPVDGTNSRGVYRAGDDRELAHLFPKALGFSRAGRLVAQAYNPGVMQVTVEGTCSRGYHATITASRKGTYWAPALTSCLTWPQPLPQALTNCNDSFVDISGLQFGITHAEYIIGEDGFWLNEIACRGGGFRISSDIAPWVSRLPFYEILYKNLLGGAVEAREPPMPQRSALLKFYRRGELPEASIDAIRALPGVLDLTRHSAQEFVSNPDNVRDAYLIILGEDAAAVDETLRRVEHICSKSS